MLALAGVHTFYGKSHILQGVSLTVSRGETVALLGRNGVGKSTTLKTIMGLVRPRAGQVLFNGEDTTGRPPHEIADRGIGYVPEDRRIFPQLTVLENLRIGMDVRGWPEAQQREALEEAYTYFPRLAERREQWGSTLSGGEQQMLAIARAFVTKPRLLLVDEPTEGLMPALVEEIGHAIQRLSKAESIAILLVEQNLRLVLEVADRVYIMEKGTIRHEAPPAAIRGQPEILHRYLGVA